MPLTATQSCAIGIEPFQVGNQIKLKITVSFLNPAMTEVDQVLTLQPQGLWNGLVPLIYSLQSGVLPGYQLASEGPSPLFDLSRITGGVLPQSAQYLNPPPPSVAWPYSRRTSTQIQVDAGQLDASGHPLPASEVVPVRAPSYSGTHATSATQTEDAINAAALAAYVPPVPLTITSLTPATGAASASTAIVIAGTGFQTGAIVLVDNAPVTPTSVSATSISVTLPSATVSPAGTYPVVVENLNGQQSNQLNFVST